MFRHTGIDSQHLLTLDDLWDPYHSAWHNHNRDSQWLFAPETTRWILVDHNRPEGELAERLAMNVSGVIDHHEDERFVPQNTEPEPRIIEKCGSCTSLVVQYFAESWPIGAPDASNRGDVEGYGQNVQNHSAIVQEPREELSNTTASDAQLARLALASILTDTTNLTNVDNVERTDQVASDFLNAIINRERGEDNPTWDRNAYFEEINTAKKEIGSIHFQSLLRKDYKQWTEEDIVIGISSVPAPLSTLIHKAKDCLKGSLSGKNQLGERDETVLREAIAQFQLKHGIEVYALMTAFTDPNDDSFKRELVIQTMKSTNRTNGLLRMFEIDSKGKEKFGLEPKTLSTDRMETDVQNLRANEDEETKQSSKEMGLWNQTDIGKSRKQVGPFLRRVVQSLPKSY